MTDKQFDDAFTAAGGWFILSLFDEIYTWNASRADLVDAMFLKGFDRARTGTNTRVSSVLRIIDENQSRAALEKCRDSKRINQMHPEAFTLATQLLAKFNL